MADLNIKFPVDLRQENRSSNANYGKWYPVNFVESTLSTQGLANHIAAHGSIVTYEVIMIVLNQLSKCIPELLSQGLGVKLDGIGTFMPKLEATGPFNTVEAASQAGADAAVKGIHMRFYPIKDELLDLTSRNFKTKCTLEFRNVVKYKQITDETTGKKTYLKAMQPIAAYLENPLINFEYSGTVPGDGGDGGDGDPDPVRP